MKPKLETVQPVLMSRDVSATMDFFEKLGFRLEGQDVAVDPKYARMRRDNVELHFQWHDAQEWDYPNDRPSYRFLVQDVEELHREISESVLSDMTPVSKTPWGTLEFHVRDYDGNLLQFYRWLEP
jgi:catechol 2,3-dioxygenase-like lactoylglutathione lyase family enzyme